MVFDLHRREIEGEEMKVRHKETFEATQWLKLGDHPAVIPIHTG